MKLGAVIASALFAVGVLACTIWLGRYGGALPAVETEGLETRKPEPPPIPDTGPPPKVVVEEPHYNFGYMGANTEKKHAYVIRNDGEGPLTLRLESTSCKCTLSKLEEESVPPGESTEVELAWTPKAPSETFRQQAVISTNDPETPQIELTVEGEVRPILTTYPMDVWSLGTINERQPTTVRGLLMSPLQDEFKILDVQTSHDLLNVEVMEIDQDLPEQLPGMAGQFDVKSGYEFVLTLEPGVDVGQFRESVTVRTDIPEAKELTFYVEGTRRGPVSFLPVGDVKWYSDAKLLDLGKFPAAEGKNVKLSMVLKEGPSEDFEITQVQSESPFVRASFRPDREFQAAGRKRYELTLDVPPGKPATSKLGSSSVKVNITTNHPDAPTVTIRVQFISL